MITLDELDRKAAQQLEGYLVRKDLVDSITAILKRNRAAESQRPASRSVSNRKRAERNEQSRLRVRISGKG